MERICETIKATQEETSVEQAKAKVPVIPLRLMFG
jgi:hypothetical protein